MNRTLLKSIREYKKQSVLAPLFVNPWKVFMEVLIPLQMAKIHRCGNCQRRFRIHCKKWV